MDKKSVIVEELGSRLERALKLLANLRDDDTTQQSEELKWVQMGEMPFRVIHLKENPSQLDLKAQQLKNDELKKENKRLKARLELLECGNNADVTRRIDDAVDQAHQIDILSRRIVEFKRREEKIVDSLKKDSGQLRRAIYLLTGYRIDALKNRIYRLSSMYAEREEDKLCFEISPTGSIRLSRTPFSDRFSDFVITYLENGDSFPAFLAAITLDLFKSTTQLSPVSMCMSTTIQPNPNYSKRTFAE